ncbi:BUD13 homolog isoform X1 [Trichomycterus rosablanca]|uniref:BUD13 homolog isoform X1 n=1 Tax=Trichomycterus rosablanca TaxID=2290929 RepID=UPI002F35AFD4
MECVIADIIDERPDEVKQLEAFRTSNKWKVLGVTNEDSQDSPNSHTAASSDGERKSRHDSPELSPKKSRHDSPDVSPKGKSRHDSPDVSPKGKSRHDSPDVSPKRTGRHDSPDVSPKGKSRHDSPDLSPKRRGRHDSPDVSPPRHKADTKHRRHDSSPPPSQKNASSSTKTQRHHRKDSPQRERTADSDLSPPRRRPNNKQGSDSDLSPPRKRKQGGRGSDSDLSPPRRRAQDKNRSDSDLSPPRRARSPAAPQGPRMLSGGAAGLVSSEVLRKEQEDIRRREKYNRPLEEQSRNAETIFRDKSGKKRDLDSERVEQSKKAGEKAAKDEKYAQWGKGVAQSQMQEQNVADAFKEAQKPLARHIDDEELDQMLREQEREGDPMAALLRKKKEKNAKTREGNERPRYRGPAPPPNRFSVMPGYRWDGVDRSNGFEQKYFSRMANKKAVQEEAYKWSVEDM